MLQIHHPFHGAILNYRHGRQTADRLTIEVWGTAPLGAAVTVNGIPARRNGEHFLAAVPLMRFENDIRAVAAGFQGSAEHTVKVVWDKYSCKRFRFSIDDNIFFLRNLAQEKPKSLFDNLYLRQLKKLYDEFGVKFTLNLFYRTPEDDFNLSQMPADWLPQFADNSDWLRMTWHAKAEFPDRPYQYAGAAQIEADCELIRREICRFAGEAAWCPPTIVHWGELQPSALPALRRCGVTALSGYFQLQDLRYAVSYGLDEARCAYLNCHDALMDFDSGIVFTRNDIVFNNTPLEQVEPTLRPLLDDADNGEYMDLLTHEQYFWPFYQAYVPDHADRIAAGLRLLTDHGYTAIWQHEGFLGVERLPES